MRAIEFEQAKIAQPRDRLKSLYSKGDFGPTFLEAAKEELPFVWGRMSLLEEFYGHNAPGLGERSRIVSDQLGRPMPLKRGLLHRLKALLI